jgi:dethiobiotin synthetase
MYLQNMSKPKVIFVTGIGTEVGKTVVSALLAAALNADYWKPIQSGDLHDTDSMKVTRFAVNLLGKVHPERHRLNAPLSPHASAALDGVGIEINDFTIPASNNEYLLVEGAGGLHVPLNDKHTLIELIQYLQVPVVLVSRHYLGSINHTLLSIEALRNRQIPIAGVIFNGPENPATEKVILEIGRVDSWFRIDEVPDLNPGSFVELIAKHGPAIREKAGKWFGLVERD